MAKYYGEIGFIETMETAPDVWCEQITKRKYSGDIIHDSRRWQTAQQLNDNVIVSNRLSIIADAYAFDHIGFIRYAVWMGVRWKVTNIDIERPRLILSLGEVYNADNAEEEEDDDE